MSKGRVGLTQHHQHHGVQPVLPAPDVAATAEWYRDVLGFEIDFLYGKPPTHGRVKAGIVNENQVLIQLTKGAAIPRALPEHGWTMINIGNDIDGLWKAYSESGATIRRPIGDREYAMRDFDIEDCNGNVIRFAQSIAESASTLPS